MIHVVIIVVLVDPEDTMREIREYQARRDQEHRQQIEELRRKSTPITCDVCGWTDWYPTPGRAKMALSGHRRRHKR